jgi:HTH-type transcriptional regulator/antitoxin HigA
MHEVSHLKHEDGMTTPVVDIDMFGREKFGDEIESRANNDAANWLVPTEDLLDFISRVGPLYSEKKIIGFANRIKVSPGLVIGRLQHLEKIGFSRFRKFLPDIRNLIIESGLTDGWGHEIG